MEIPLLRNRVGVSGETIRDESKDWKCRTLTVDTADFKDVSCYGIYDFFNYSFHPKIEVVDGTECIRLMRGKTKDDGTFIDYLEDGKSYSYDYGDQKEAFRSLIVKEDGNAAYFRLDGVLSLIRECGAK